MIKVKDIGLAKKVNKLFDLAKSNMPILASIGDIFITAKGDKHVISEYHFASQ